MFRSSIVLEPEAASCYFHYLPIEQSRDNGSLASMKPGSKYMIIDCGGNITEVFFPTVLAVCLSVCLSICSSSSQSVCISVQLSGLRLYFKVH